MPSPYDQASQLDLNEPANREVTNRGFLTNLFAGQRGDTTGYLDRLTGAIRNQEPLTHMYDRIGRELNIPNLRANAVGAANTLTNLPYALSGAARGFDVNANQLTRAIATKTAGLQPLVETTQRALQSAQDVMGQRIGFTQEQQKKELLPYQSEEKFLADRFARETSGYSESFERELKGLLAKLQAGVTLNEGERDRANAIALQKMIYDQAIKTTEMNNRAGIGSFWG